MTRADARVGPTLYTYDARGALLTRRLPNNSCTYYAYDAAGRLTKLEDRWDEGAPIQTFEFTRDPNGNITRSLREDGSCWYYAYDGLQRLTGAEWKDSDGSTLYGFEYEYDKVGNRLRFAQNGVSTYYSYNEANELLCEVTPGSETAYYAFDGRGNQIRRSVLAGHTTYFSYNSRNLVSGIWSTDPTFTPNYFEYNALGQRIKKVDSTGTTRYLWDGLNILLETDASGNLTRRYTHGYSPIEGVSSLIAVEGPIQCPCFYHFDQVGGVRHLTDPYHNTIKSYAYEPFGRILAESGNAPNDFTFPATYVVLAQLRTHRLSPSRLYDAASGRFIARDARKHVEPTNLYGYGSSRPLSDCDPTGLEEPAEGTDGRQGAKCHDCVFSFPPYKIPDQEPYRFQFVTVFPVALYEALSPEHPNARFNLARMIRCVFRRLRWPLWDCCIEDSNGKRRRVLQGPLAGWWKAVDITLGDPGPGATQVRVPLVLPLPYGKTVRVTDLGAVYGWLDTDSRGSMVQLCKALSNIARPSVPIIPIPDPVPTGCTAREERVSK
jgi:RHS repeat-associated protein